MSVLVLMSTYNGEKYIRTQLESILTQNYEELTVLIRDDGSTDATPSILDSYTSLYPQLQWYPGHNIGVCQSFFELIRKAELSYDYYSFADQDDQWLPEKISRAVSILDTYPHETPALYCSDKIIVDEHLEPINVTVSRVMKKATFGNALVQDMCTGCTAVMNRRLLEIIRHQTPEFVIMHDWWFYLTATCFGEVYYDQESYIKYRQHGHNTSGAMLSRKDLLKHRIRELKKPRGEIYRQVEEFIRIFDPQLNNEPCQYHSSSLVYNKNLAEKLLKSRDSFIYRLKVVFDTGIYRQKFSDTIILYLVILIGKL